MLASLYIENIFLINKIHINFDKDLNVFTGETGSGKSIILDSINLVIGGRAKGGILKENCQSGLIIAEFILDKDSHQIIEQLNENGYSIDSNVLLLKRIITPNNSANKIFINDTPASTRFVDSITTKIIEINDQFSNNKLLNGNYFISILDNIAKHKNELSNLSKYYNIWCEEKVKLESLIKQNEENKSRVEYDKMIFNDLHHLNLTSNEEENLIAKKNNIESSLKCIDKVKDILVLSDKYQLINGLSQITRISSTIKDQVSDNLSVAIQEVENATIAIREFVNQISDIINDNNDHMQELEAIEERLFTIKSLARRYKNTHQSLYGLYSEVKNRLESTENFDSEIELLNKTISENYKQLINIAQNISKNRKSASKTLIDGIMQEMQDLKLENTRIEMEFLEKAISSDGVDKTNCLISMNLGTSMQPLQDIASGGELSRFMLAMKAVTSAIDDINTVVFDEIESGVSGNIMDKIANKMSSIAINKQVIVVTHSATIAAKANHHFKVSKKVVNNETVVNVQKLNPKERISEIATMIDGENPSEVAINMAKKLLDKE